jgi:hypothetical protein
VGSLLPKKQSPVAIKEHESLAIKAKEENP